MRTLYAIVGIAPSADFGYGDHFRLLLRRMACLVMLDHVGRWIATTSYSISIMGAARLWGIADPKV